MTDGGGLSQNSLSLILILGTHRLVSLETSVGLASLDFGRLEH